MNKPISFEKYITDKKNKNNKIVSDLVDQVEKETDNIDYDAITRAVTGTTKDGVDSRFTDKYEKNELEKFRNIDTDIPEEAWDIFKD